MKFLDTVNDLFFIFLNQVFIKIFKVLLVFTNIYQISIFVRMKKTEPNIF